MALQMRFFTGGETVQAAALTALTLDKEIYTPYSQLRARGYMDIDPAACLGASRVDLLDGETLLHSGAVETFSCYRENGVATFEARSRGYTALLLQNQLKPGVLENMSLNKLMTNYYTFPDAITWEQSEETTNYLYAKENTGMWDGVVHLAYKLKGTYPFVRASNEIRLTIPDDAQTFDIAGMQDLLTRGVTNEQSLLYSDYYMEDAAGNGEAFSLHVPEVASLGILRTRWLALDEQYFYDPRRRWNFAACMPHGTWCALSRSFPAAPPRNWVTPPYFPGRTPPKPSDAFGCSSMRRV